MTHTDEMNKIPVDCLDSVAGGHLSDYTAEELLEEARQTAVYWKHNGRTLEHALDLLSRLFFEPGKTTREEIERIIMEVYNDPTI